MRKRHVFVLGIIWSLRERERDWEISQEQSMCSLSFFLVFSPLLRYVIPNGWYVYEILGRVQEKEKDRQADIYPWMINKLQQNWRPRQSTALRARLALSPVSVRSEREREKTKKLSSIRESLVIKKRRARKDSSVRLHYLLARICIAFQCATLTIAGRFVCQLCAHDHTAVESEMTRPIDPSETARATCREQGTDLQSSDRFRSSRRTERIYWFNNRLSRLISPCTHPKQIRFLSYSQQECMY